MKNRKRTGKKSEAKKTGKNGQLKLISNIKANILEEWISV